MTALRLLSMSGVPAQLAEEVEALLRCEGRHRVGDPDVPWVRITLVLLTCCFLYGAALGSFGWRWEQAVYSAIKVPMLLFVTSVIVLPNFYVVNMLLGLGKDFGAALGGVYSALATVAITLLALAPVTLFVYASGCSYRLAVLSNGVYFLFATVAGQVVMGRHYQPLVLKNPHHRTARRAWMLLFIFVAIQMAWTLRPFVGSPDLDPSLFRDHGHFRNAYVVVADSIWKFLQGK